MEDRSVCRKARCMLLVFPLAGFPFAHKAAIPSAPRSCVARDVEVWQQYMPAKGCRNTGHRSRLTARSVQLRGRWHGMTWAGGGRRSRSSEYCNDILSCVDGESNHNSSRGGGFSCSLTGQEPTSARAPRPCTTNDLPARATNKKNSHAPKDKRASGPFTTLQTTRQLLHHPTPRPPAHTPKTPRRHPRPLSHLRRTLLDRLLRYLSRPRSLASLFRKANCLQPRLLTTNSIVAAVGDIDRWHGVKGTLLCIQRPRCQRRIANLRLPAVSSRIQAGGGRWRRCGQVLLDHTADPKPLC
jgi:hypothetical protein